MSSRPYAIVNLFQNLIYFCAILINVELIFIFVVGLAIGSFLNVLIDRLPQDKSIFGRSHCDFCKKKLPVKDLIPVLSFLFLKGKCRYCKKRLSLQYPLVELITGIVFVLIPFVIPDLIGNRILNQVENDIVIFLYLGLVSGLIALFFADWKYHVIPDQIQIGLFIFSAGILYFQGLSEPFSWLIRFRDGVLVMLPILGLYLVTKGKGMGFADVKFAFIIGFFLQLVSGLYAIYFGFIIGAISGIFLVFSGKKKMKDAIAFGPFLALGFALMVFAGKPIVEFLQKFYL